MAETVNRPDLDIIIPHYGGTDILWRCLTHLWCFAPPNTRIVIVDDASPDGAEKIGAFCMASGRAVYHRHETNKGYSAACNTGLRLTQADAAPAVIFLNNDSAVLPDTLQLLMYVYKNTDHKVVCAGVKQGENGKGNDPSNYIHATPLKDVTLLRGFCFVCTLIDRKLIDEIGGLYEGCRQHFSDIDFDLKARMLGHEPTIVAEAFAYHGAGMSAKRGGAKAMCEQYIKDREAFYARWPSKNAPYWMKPERTLDELVAMNEEVWRHVGESA